MDAQQLGRQVLKRRKEMGISQETLAEQAGLSRNYISLIERGAVVNVSVNVVAQLAQALGASPAELLQGADEDGRLVPPALREFALEAGLRFDVVDWLMRMPRRGQEPKTPEDWRQLYDAVRPYLEVDD